MLGRGEVCRRDLQCLLTSKVFDAGDESGGRVSGMGGRRREEAKLCRLVAGFREQEQEQDLQSGQLLGNSRSRS